MLKFLHAKNLNIFSQLKIEEFLLKNKKDSYCIINEGTQKAIVLGICNKPNKLVNIQNIQKDPIPIIRRFSGGGTVFVDENTIFITFILSKDFLKIELFPENIMRWAESFYKKVFKLKNFKLLENDFVIGTKKIAGNAKYIKKDRFLLHSSFLMDYDIKNIQKYLLMPNKAPVYRLKRSHKDFLLKIKNIMPQDDFVRNFKEVLKEIFNYKALELADIHLK